MKNDMIQPATILVVDDNPINLQVIIEHLGETGFRTLVARNGEGALRQAARARPDLILLDVMMPPGIDGFETCTWIKNNDVTQDIPVIFMTVLSEPVDKLRGFNAGGVDYVPKPVHHEEVIARINAHLSRCNRLAEWLRI